MARTSTSFNSTAIASADWDDETGACDVTFTSGQTYSSSQPVPPEIWAGFVDAPSPGRYWHSVLKGVYF